MKLDKYLNEIRDTADRLGPGRCAYRGQGKASWPLQSAATRRLIIQRGDGIQSSPQFLSHYLDYHTGTLIGPARAQGLGTDTGREISDLQLLAKLQHLGAATGLLDFSWDPLVGLWFACEHPSEDGKLFIVDTNNPVQVALVSADESKQGTTDMFTPEDAFTEVGYWEPVASGDAAARILRQRSVFIIGKPLISEDTNIIAEINVYSDDKAELVRELGLLDVNQKSLFLDLHGFAGSNRVADPFALSQDDYLSAANWHYQSGHYRLAVESYNRFISIDSTYYIAYFHRGNAYAELQEHTKAIEDYDSSIDVMGRFPQSVVIDSMIYFNRANSKAGLGHFNEAVDDYLQAITAIPGQDHQHFNLANTYVDLHQFKEAVLFYDRVTSANRDTIFNKGNALMCLGRFDEAYECYAQADAMDPGRESTENNLKWSSWMASALSGIDYECQLENPSPAGVSASLRILVSDEDFSPELTKYVYQVSGGVGNTGNSGFTMRGRRGFRGKNPIAITIGGGRAYDPFVSRGEIQS